ncbi:MAG TPA: pitrilysin family protein [Terriglobales bacterium]|nr:pitrilysin family protein [Terriglobales bacterium]
MRFFVRKSVLLVLLLAVVALPVAAQQDLIASFEKRITVNKLHNGLTVLVCERPEAPVFSFFTHVNAGSANDPLGQTGLAHMFEHMAFKGTDKIGTTNYPAEKAALSRVEKSYAAYDAERQKEIGRDPKRLAELEKAWKSAMDEANKYVVQNEFGRIVEENGGVGLNAFTSEDETGYVYSMPVNRLQLWAYLESQRFLHPVMREFYKERDVVIEERRMRTDSNPIGRLIEQFNGAAFIAHPYQRPGVGWMSDLTSFSATDAMQFYNNHYVPSEMVVTVVGDVKGQQIMPTLNRYFSQLPAKPKPQPIITVEPPQNAERRVVLKDPSQPFYIEGYHRPDFRDPDDAVYDAISDLMSNGRTSRLYRSLVRDKKIAAFAAGFSGLPGQKFPHLFAFYAVPIPGRSPAEIAAAIHEEIEKLKTQDVTDEELKMVKTRAKANLVRSLGSNEGLAQMLGTMQARFGDWRELFRNVERIDKVTKADIRRVASKTFVDTNRTVGIIETAAPATAADASQGATR